MDRPEATDDGRARPASCARAAALDFGHLVRREDNCWGTARDHIEFANADTFHMTNCTPQHEDFNRAAFGRDGIWGQLENYIQSQAERDGTISRLSVFAGPIFNERKDLVYSDVRVPTEFWKVEVAPWSSGGVRAFGFILAQADALRDDPPYEEFVPGRFRQYQVPLTEIQAKTLIRFAKSTFD
jgi:endonuclease G